MLLVRDSLKVLDKVDEDGFVLLELALLPEKNDSMLPERDSFKLLDKVYEDDGS